ncbi:MAG: hypothetical protein JW910_03870, partial [Anaerolineae bacterium]|nr:hypothetical protein [Anaerolineae bacterium]
MGIDYIIHYECEPKRALTLEGLMGRLKSRDRANTIIRLYRDHGDERSPSQMGFEMMRRLADGTEQREVIVVQDLLDAAEDLKPFEPHCAGCPANRTGASFGCVGSINYPISERGERWLLDQLPGQDHPLVFLLLQRAIREIGYSGKAAARLRAQDGVFLEATVPPQRDLEALIVSGDQVFEMLFLSGPIQPAHATLLLQFFGGISREMDADIMMQLAAPPSQAWIDQYAPFSHQTHESDDDSTASLKEFLRALYLAFRCGAP